MRRRIKRTIPKSLVAEAAGGVATALTTSVSRITTAVLEGSLREFNEQLARVTAERDEARDLLRSARQALCEDTEAFEPQGDDLATLRQMLHCARQWQSAACLVGNVRAGDITYALERVLSSRDKTPGGANVKPSLRAWRALVRIEAVLPHEGIVRAVVPAWNYQEQVEIALAGMPVEMRSWLASGPVMPVYAHAHATIGAERREDLTFAVWEMPHNYVQQALQGLPLCQISGCLDASTKHDELADFSAGLYCDAHAPAGSVDVPWSVCARRLRAMMPRRGR